MIALCCCCCKRAAWQCEWMEGVGAGVPLLLCILMICMCGWSDGALRMRVVCKY